MLKGKVMVFKTKSDSRTAIIRALTDVAHHGSDYKVLEGLVVQNPEISMR